MPRRPRVEDHYSKLNGRGFAVVEGGDTVHICVIEDMVAEILDSKHPYDTGPLEGTSLCGRQVTYVGRPGLAGDELVCQQCLKARPKEKDDDPGE